MMACQNYTLDLNCHNWKPKPCSQPPSPLALIHWFDLIGLLVEIHVVEQLLCSLHHSMIEMKVRAKGRVGGEGYTCHQCNLDKANSILSMEVLNISIIEPDIYVTSGQVDCGISENIKESSLRGSNLEYDK